MMPNYYYPPPLMYSEGPDEYIVPSEAYAQQPIQTEYRCLMCGALLHVTLTATLRQPPEPENLYASVTTSFMSGHPVLEITGTMQHLC